MSCKCFFIVMLPMLLAGSCISKPQLEVKRYSNGNIESEIFFLDDSVIHGKAKYYYSEGGIKADLMLDHNKRKGLSKYYFKNGKLESETNYLNDLLDGEAKWYYPNGNLKNKSYWKSGKDFGSSYFFYSNGKLQIYQCKDFYGNGVYLLKYDSAGNILQEEGVVFSPEVKIVPEKSTGFTLNEKVSFLITVAQPPKYLTRVWTRDYIKGVVTNRVPREIENSTVIATNSYTEPGQHGLVIIGEFLDQSGLVVSRDSTVRMVTVGH